MWDYFYVSPEFIHMIVKLIIDAADLFGAVSVAIDAHPTPC
jgi:hypothetical protein